MYDGGPPPWDIGRPQPTFVELADQGLLVGRVLDIGCGTGEHALMAAARGLDATGIDAVPKAIGHAQRKAEDRGLTARFLVADALRLADLGERFDTVLDCGLFHIFSDEDRPRFVASLGVPCPPAAIITCCASVIGNPGRWGRDGSASLRSGRHSSLRLGGSTPLMR